MSSKPPLKSLQELKSFGNFILPGGLPVYDTKDGSFLFFIETPIVLNNLLGNVPRASRGGIRLDQLRAFGIGLEDEKVVFQYPDKQISLESYTGTLEPLQLVFEKPSELDKVTKATMSQFLLLVLHEQTLEAGNTKTIRARYVTETQETEISVLGLCIANPQQFQNANLEPSIYPPSSLRLDLPPNHIPSQHLGECASDTMQTELFFADGFHEVFATQAEAIYKQFIKANPRVLFDVEHPELLRATIERLRVIKSSENLDSVQHILANMVRRYIFVRLLDFSTTKQIETLKVQQTQCLIPKGVSKLGEMRGRRPSINLYGGLSIHEHILKIVGRRFELGKNYTVQARGYNYFHYIKIICSILESMEMTIPYTILLARRLKIVPVNPAAVRAVSIFVENIVSATAFGHVISIFRNSNKWYLQDNNIGIAKYIDDVLDIDFFLGNLCRFFLCDFNHLKLKETQPLLENQWFTEDEIQKGHHKASTYYGFIYRDKTGVLVQRILYVDRGVSSNDSFMEGDLRLIYCIGEVSPEAHKAAETACYPGQTSNSNTKNVPVATTVSKRLTLSEEVLQQLQAPFDRPLARATKEANPLPPSLTSQLQEQLSGFEKKAPVKKPTAASLLSVKNLSALKNQFSGFSNTTDKGK